DFSSLYDIEILTLYEYKLQMKAYQLKQVDKQNEMHMQAWLNHAVTGTKEQGKKQVPVYKKYKDFFDYEKQLNEIEQPSRKTISPRMKKLAQIAAKANEGR